MERTQTGGERKTSRICIKHLPHGLTDAVKLKEHLFHTRQSYFPHTAMSITDCKVLSKRRMAFVGFSSVDAAAACVQYLHRSYFRTTQLLVEFALPPKETSARMDQQSATNAESKDEPQQNSKHKLNLDIKRDAKKNEFLEAMGALPEKTTNSRVWSNDDGIMNVTNQARQYGEQPGEPSSDESGSDDESDEDDLDPLEATTRTGALGKESDFLRSKTIAVQDLDETKELNGEDEEQSEEDEETPMKAETHFHHGAISDGDEKITETSDEVEPENDNATSSTRLFVRNIAFDTSEEDMKEFFSSYGNVEECHIPVDDQRRGKGFGFVTFDTPTSASAARNHLDGTDFQGRLIHILPARLPPSAPQHEKANMSYKERQELGRRGKSMEEQHGWSASHLRSDAVVDNLAARLGIQKGDILPVKDGMSGGDAAVRLALAETAIIEENREYFAEHGIDMEALVSFSTKENETSKARSQTCILVKNLPHDTTTEELSKTFGSQGSNPSRILLPPSRTVAVVEFIHAHDAKKAFKGLAYRRFKTVPLYLEWAPVASIVKKAAETDEDNGKSLRSVVTADDGGDAMDDSPVQTTAIYVKNLNFSTTEDDLRSVFERSVGGVRTVRIPRKVAPKKRNAVEMDTSASDQPNMSMGYGFVEFQSQEKANIAVKALQGKLVAGHALELQISKGSALHTQAQIPFRPPSKIMARNVPFQASRKDLLQLFGTFGQLKKVRLPKKFDGNHRGFAFIEFVSGKEAAAAMNALSRTHLYGRHLVLEWAESGEEGMEGTRDTSAGGTTMNKKIRFDKESN